MSIVKIFAPGVEAKEEVLKKWAEPAGRVYCKRDE
jgi:hypothetical protein